MEVIYKSFNGKEFKSKEECEDYEKEFDENHNFLYKNLAIPKKDLILDKEYLRSCRNSSKAT